MAASDGLTDYSRETRTGLEAPAAGPAHEVSWRRVPHLSIGRASTEATFRE
jgi:hypothetical protein